MSGFNYREFVSGDEESINQLYFQVTGRTRQLSEYAWQWWESPSGPGDIWLIHQKGEQGDKLIGHHGVMPIRFTKGNLDLLFGKIENTMVLPEYRTKILYPRFEIKFKNNYQRRYDALFATMGPESAIRIRKACGYEFPVEWKNLILKVAPLGEVIWVIDKIARRVGLPISSPNNPNLSTLSKAGFLSSMKVRQAEFFRGFWSEARHNHGIAPRRDIEDLEWKFWSNPYKPHYTFIVDDGACPGYAIISLGSDGAALARLEDYAVLCPSPKNYQLFLDALLAALHQAGFGLLRVVTTTDPSLEAVNTMLSTRQAKFMNFISSRRSGDAKKMPRYITESGLAKGLDLNDWEVTGLVFEGR